MFYVQLFKNNIPYAMVAFLALIIVMKSLRKSWRIAIWSGLFAAYLTFLFTFTALPLPHQTGVLTMSEVIKQIVTEPFTPIIQSGRIAIHQFKLGNHYSMYLFLSNLIGNIVLFMPFVIFMKALKRYSDLFILGSSILLSAAIECLQIVVNVLSHSIYRIVDVNDLILNIFGSCLMLSLLQLFFHRQTTKATSPSTNQSKSFSKKTSQKSKSTYKRTYQKNNRIN